MALVMGQEPYRDVSINNLSMLFWGKKTHL